MTSAAASFRDHYAAVKKRLSAPVIKKPEPNFDSVGGSIVIDLSRFKTLNANQPIKVQYGQFPEDIREAVTTQVIVRTVASFFGVTVSDMTSSRRPKNLYRPRQIAVLLCKEMTKASMPMIGERLNRDHSSICHAYTKITELVASDPVIAAQVEEIRAIIQGHR